MGKSMIDEREYTVIDISDRLEPTWHRAEICELQLKTGAELRATITGDDIDCITWRLDRTYDGVTSTIGGSMDREKSVEAAKAAAWKAIEVWRDLVEYKAAILG